jgi:predicted acetyltransferase
MARRYKPTDIHVRSDRGCDTFDLVVVAPNSLTFRRPDDADWPAMTRLAGASFGGFRPKETTDMWRTLIPEHGAVVACDGPDLVGMAYCLKLHLTVPGGAVLPMAGLSWVCVAPTHRRRGVLREMIGELHRAMVLGDFPIAGLEASEGGIYGRFGYGPATIDETLTIDTREARFHADVPDTRGVRFVPPVDHRDQLAEVYERWRLRTPGGLHTPSQMWDEVLEDREIARHGGSALFALLHDDGFALFRQHGADERKSVVITKLAAVTDEAYVALWRTLLGMDLKDTVTVQAPPNSLLPYLLDDPRLVRITGREDGLWLRIIDVPTALEARTYEGELSVVLELADGGRYALEVRGGQARCQPTDADPDVFLDRSVLGSLYLGTHRASSFAAAHRLQCHDAAFVAGFDAAFASRVPAQLGFGF